MALVDYSSSEEEDENDENDAIQKLSPNLKRKREDESASDLPPLPSKFYDLYASTTRVSTRDDPSLHGGRKRIVPHIEGNWPTHLYTEWYPSTAESSTLSNLISALRPAALSTSDFKVHSFLTSDLGAPLPLHISFSRPIGFRTEQKDEFVESFQKAIGDSGIRPFDVQFAGLDWVANFENTRWFLVLRLKKPALDGLNRLLHVCNLVVENHGQPPLYAVPQAGEDNETASRSATKFKARTDIHVRKKSLSAQRASTDCTEIRDISDAFHFSIAWTLAKPNSELLLSTQELAKMHFDKIKAIQVKVSEIKAKVGNVISSVPLPTDVVVRRGLFGV